MAHYVSVLKASFDNQGAVDLLFYQCVQNWSPCKTQTLTKPELLQQVAIVVAPGCCYRLLLMS